VSSREKILVESRVNSFALFSVLRAGRVRKFEKCISYGDRSKKFEVIPDIQKLGTGQKNGLGKNWGIGDGSKNMFWDSSNLPWGQAQK
jgi:hypothetical protein